jgi:hypothetical protein
MLDARYQVGVIQNPVSRILFQTPLRCDNKATIIAMKFARVSNPVRIWLRVAGAS